MHDSIQPFVNPNNVQMIRQAFELQECMGTFYPSVYVLEPISRCNLRCIMCPNRLMPSSNLGDMDLGTFRKITEDIAPYAEFVMLYWMGEPLLHPQFSQMLSIARENIRGRIVVSTNLTVLSEEMIDSLLQNCDIIVCCIDRWDSKEYEKIRKGANFASVVKNAERLLARREIGNRAEVVLKCLDLSNTSDEYAAFAQHWQSRGGKPLFAWLNGWAGTFPGLRHKATLPIPNTEGKRQACADLWFKMVINWRGKVQMCCFDWEYAFGIGSIDQADWMRSAWQGDTVVSLRKAHIAGKFSANSRCGQCTAWAPISDHDAYIQFDDASYFAVF